MKGKGRAAVFPFQYTKTKKGTKGQSLKISSLPRTYPVHQCFAFELLPRHASQVSHKFPKVFLPYSIVIAACWKCQNGTSSFVTATCRKRRETCLGSITCTSAQQTDRCCNPRSIFTWCGQPNPPGLQC